MGEWKERTGAAVLQTGGFGVDRVPDGCSARGPSRVQCGGGRHGSEAAPKTPGLAPWVPCPRAAPALLHVAADDPLWPASESTVTPVLLVTSPKVLYGIPTGYSRPCHHHCPGPNPTNLPCTYIVDIVGPDRRGEKEQTLSIGGQHKAGSSRAGPALVGCVIGRDGGLVGATVRDVVVWQTARAPRRRPAPARPQKRPWSAGEGPIEATMPASWGLKHTPLLGSHAACCFWLFFPKLHPPATLVWAGLVR